MTEDEIRNRETLARYLQLVRVDCLRLLSTDRFVSVLCPACGAEDSLPEFQKDGFEYDTCRACETLFARTRPTFAGLEDFYTNSEATTYWINEFFRPMAEVRRERIFRPRAEYVVKHFGEDPSWRIADIGAGFGLFSDELRKLWPRSSYVAIEPSREQAMICRSAGIEVIEQSVEEIRGHQNTFDLMTAFELLEHLHEPRRFLSAARVLLKPGGRLLMTTLNGLGFDIQILWENSKSIYPPCHINFFNPNSVARMLEDLGFRVCDVATPGKLDWDIVEGAIRHEEAAAGRIWKLTTRKVSKSGKQDLQDWITRNGLSSHMRILAEKI